MKVFRLLLFIIVIALFIWGFWNFGINRNKVEAPVISTSTSPLTEETREVNFSQTGNLVKNNPGMEQDVWYLIYEEPGALALNVRLEFDKKSLCNGNICVESLFGQGERVDIFGFNDGNFVIVKELISK